jgi:hypothetical protein
LQQAFELKDLTEREKKTELSWNAEYKCKIIIYMNRPKNALKGIFTASQLDYPDRVHSDQMVVGAVRLEAGPQERGQRCSKLS